ncbi:MAG: helix-turn-helix domain-containing protein [Alphaproteobacteria bacterium]
MPKHRINDELTKEFKENLKSILEERKGQTNPKRLSKDAGLGETAVRDILQNHSSSPKLETIEKLANALNVPVYRLIPSMVDHSYAQIVALREENELLRDATGIKYNTREDLLKAAKERKNKK